MSTCIPVSSEVVATSVGESVVTNIVTVTAPPQTIETSVAVQTSACVPGASINGTAGAEVCSDFATLVPTQTVLPGAESTSTQLVTNPITQLITSISVGSSCRALPPSSSSIAAVVPSSSSSAPPRSSTTPPTSARSTSAPTAAVTPSGAESISSSVPVVTSDAAAADPTAAAGRSTITSFRTVIVTSTGRDGRATTITSAGTLNSAQPGDSSTNTGAIAGGVVGGVAALALIAVLFWLLRSKGYFKRDDEQFDDDMWAPHHHSPDAPGPHGDDPYASTGGDLINEKDAGPVSNGGHGGRPETRASWYGSETGRSLYPDRMGGSLGPHGGYETAGAVALSRGHSVGQTDRRISRQQSMRSGSGHSHDGYSPTGYAHTLPPIPSQYRFSQHEHLGHQPTELPYGAFPAHEEQRHEQHDRQRSVRRTLSGSREGPMSASDHSDSARTAATTGSTSGLSHRGHPQGHPPLDKATSICRGRPNLAVLTNTSNSGTESSLSDTTQSSLSTAPSSLVPTPPADVDGKEHLAFDNQLLGASRPKMERAASSSSFIVPSQFLGARITNA